MRIGVFTTLSYDDEIRKPALCKRRVVSSYHPSKETQDKHHVGYNAEQALGGETSGKKKSRPPLLAAIGIARCALHRSRRGRVLDVQRRVAICAARVMELSPVLSHRVCRGRYRRQLLQSRPPIHNMEQSIFSASKAFAQWVVYEPSIQDGPTVYEPVLAELLGRPERRSSLGGFSQASSYGLRGPSPSVEWPPCTSPVHVWHEGLRNNNRKASLTHICSPQPPSHAVTTLPLWFSHTRLSAQYKNRQSTTRPFPWKFVKDITCMTSITALLVRTVATVG